MDPRILDITRRRIVAPGADIELCQARIEDVGFEPASFDRVVTTFVLRHLTTEEKLSAPRAVRRVLRPDGELHVADFGPPQNGLMWLFSLPIRWLGDDRIAANVAGRLSALMRDAGFTTAARRNRLMTPLGTVVH